MTDDEAAAEMNEIILISRGDPEAGHSMADALLLKVLRSLGYERTCDAFERVEAWYA